MEAAAWGIPSIAISTETELSLHHAAEYGELNWETAAYFTACLTEMVLRQGLPPEIGLLNVNVPVPGAQAGPELSHPGAYVAAVQMTAAATAAASMSLRQLRAVRTVCGGGAGPGAGAGAGVPAGRGAGCGR